MANALGKTIQGKTEDERIFVATQWQLIWWKFRKHKMAMVSGVIILIFYLAALFAEFVGPYDPEQFFPKYKLAPPTKIHLFHEGKRVDAVLIKNELRRKGELDKVGGEPYLAQLVAAVPSAAGAEEYARIVSEKAATRNLIHVCTQIQLSAYEEAAPGHDLLDWAEGQIFALGRGAAEQDTVRI